MDKKPNIRRLCVCALMCAVVVVLTIVPKIPVPGTNGAYINLGDVGVYLSALLLGPWLGAAAGGLASGLSDVLLGSMVYAPATLVIKAAMAVVFGLIVKKGGFVRYLVAALASGAIMAGGYALYELIMFGGVYALAGLPMNLIQYGAGVAITLALYKPAHVVKEQVKL